MKRTVTNITLLALFCWLTAGCDKKDDPKPNGEKEVIYSDWIETTDAFGQVIYELDPEEFPLETTTVLVFGRLDYYYGVVTIQLPYLNTLTDTYYYTSRDHYNGKVYYNVSGDGDIQYFEALRLIILQGEVTKGTAGGRVRAYSSMTYDEITELYGIPK